MELAIVVSSLILGLAYALPKKWMIRAQEDIVRMQVEQLLELGTPTTMTGGDGSQTSLDLHSPYS